MTISGPSQEDVLAVAEDGTVNCAPMGVEWGEDMHVLLEAAIRKPNANLESLARSLTREISAPLAGSSVVIRHWIAKPCWTIFS